MEWLVIWFYLSAVVGTLSIMNSVGFRSIVAAMVFAPFIPVIFLFGFFLAQLIKWRIMEAPKWL